MKTHKIDTFFLHWKIQHLFVLWSAYRRLFLHLWLFVFGRRWTRPFSGKRPTFLWDKEFFGTPNNSILSIRHVHNKKKNKFWSEQSCIHRIFIRDGTDDCRDGNDLKFPESLESVFTLTSIFPDQLEHFSDVLKECVTDRQTDGWTDGWTDHSRPPGEPSRSSLDSQFTIYWSRVYFRCSEKIP